MTVRVLLVDDNALFRAGVVRILEADGRFEVVGEASTGDEGLGLVSELLPDLVLLDLKMPGSTAPETVAAMVSLRGDLPIGILTVFETDAMVQPAMEAGARGYVPKDATPEELCEAAMALMEGKSVRLEPPKDAAVAAVESLTAREREVLRALASGATYTQIARDMAISPKTLRNHISNTYHKLEIYDRAQAVIVAVRSGLVDVPDFHVQPPPPGE